MKNNKVRGKSSTLVTIIGIMDKIICINLLLKIFNLNWIILNHNQDWVIWWSSYHWWHYLQIIDDI